jgi:hypothetical protein
MRIGHGYDVHRFAEGDFITLGGVRIAHGFGLLRWVTSASISRTPTRNSRAPTAVCCCVMSSH